MINNNSPTLLNDLYWSKEGARFRSGIWKDSCSPEEAHDRPWAASVFLLGVYSHSQQPQKCSKVVGAVSTIKIVFSESLRFPSFQFLFFDVRILLSRVTLKNPRASVGFSWGKRLKHLNYQLRTRISQDHIFTRVELLREKAGVRSEDRCPSFGRLSSFVRAFLHEATIHYAAMFD